MSHKQKKSAYPNTYPNDEISLIALSKNLWTEKLTIIYAVLIAIVVATLYISTTKSTYIISAQLIVPKAASFAGIKPIISQIDSELFLYTPDAPLKQQQELLDLIKRGDKIIANTNTISNTNTNTNTNDKDITEKSAFALFLQTLESRAHINGISLSNSQLLEDTLGIRSDDENLIESISQLRSIEYANTQKKNNELEPDSYYLTLEGYSREGLKELIIKDLQLASTTTVREIKAYYTNQLSKLLSEANSQQDADLNGLENRIKAREWYLLTRRKSEILQLQEKLNIEQAINGTNTLQLTAQLEQLRNRSNDTFHDADLTSIKAQKQLVKNSVYISQIKQELEKIKDYQLNVNFFDNFIDSPVSPIKPRKTTILAMSVILGGILGLVIALGKSAYRNHNKENG